MSAVARRHAAYWHGLRLGGYMGGLSTSDEAASSASRPTPGGSGTLIAVDPFVR
jgi:hypothetical protein